MFSKLIRRTHMYLALFLTPWMLMYALSTMAMNHGELLRKLSGGNPVTFEKERELRYSVSFPSDSRPEEVGARILKDFQLEGAYSARREGSGALTVLRQDPITPRRIRYWPAESRLVIEKQAFRMLPFFERMHRRRGYQHPYLLEDSWAFSVDLVIAAMIFWVLSGFWMWWELRTTRRLGALFFAGGLALFGLFLVTI